MLLSSHKFKIGRIFTMGFFLAMFLFLPTAYPADEENPSTCDIAYPSDDKIEWKCYRLKREESLESLFGDRWQDVARFNRIDRRHALPGTKLKVPARLEDIEDFAPIPAELEYPSANGDQKLILIDLIEQYLGAYEKGRLVFSSPITSGKPDFITPPGEYRINAYSLRHSSSLYRIDDKDFPYPMHYGLRFLVDENEISYWIHGRDMPGYPASHGCVGLYDEDMQKEFYGFPEYPLMDTTRKLYQWAIAPNHDDGEFHHFQNGPRVLVTGEPPGEMNRPPNVAPGP